MKWISHYVTFNVCQKVVQSPRQAVWYSSWENTFQNMTNYYDRSSNSLHSPHFNEEDIIGRWDLIKHVCSGLCFMLHEIMLEIEAVSTS